MYEFLKGNLVEKNPTHIILDIAGIGYRVYIPHGTYAKLPPMNNLVTVFTSFIVKEDSQTLYGFLTKDEKLRFETLITISGVGPKLALTLTGYLDQSVFQTALQANNPLILAKIPGVGKKTAQRLILELKDKLKYLINDNGQENNILSDCVNALVNLGYNSPKAQIAVQEVLEKENLKEIGLIITKALKILN